MDFNQQRFTLTAVYFCLFFLVAYIYFTRKLNSMNKGYKKKWMECTNRLSRMPQIQIKNNG